MADIVVAPIMERVIGKAVDLIANEIIITATVGDALKRLFEVLESIKAVDQVAEKRAGHDRMINIWLKRLNDVAYDAEDILDLVATKAREVRHPVTSCVSDTLFKCDIGHKIKDLLERLKTINAEKEIFSLGNPEPVTDQAYLPNRETGSLRSGSAVVGRMTVKEKIITALLAPANLNNQLVVIPITGMGGVGKTTLAQLIYNDKQITGVGEKEKRFSISMWVHVGQKFSVTGILKELMVYVPDYIKDIEHLSLNQLGIKVGGFLSSKRFFLVLDDVWMENPEDWDTLKTVLKQGETGSAVLVTSRNMEVAKMMDAESETHQLETLNTDESWELFCECAFRTDVVVPDDLKEIGKQITKMCEGLPLAINALGKLLFRKKEAKYWMEVLRNDISVLEEKGKVTILQLLKLSFDHLPSFLKPCFLLLSIFPKGHSFEKSEQVKIWIAEGYILLLHPGDNLEDVGNRYFDELCDRSFFLSSGVSGDHSYRMHDFHHDLALSISGTKYTQVKKETFNNIDQNSRHISMLCDSIQKPTLDLTRNCRKVRTILLPGENLRNFGIIPDEDKDKEIQKKQILEKNILNDLFHTLKYIRVLDLSSSSTCALPNSINKLQLLRYLDLSKTEIRMLPASICDLLNLQTLRLLRCLLLDELPKHLARVTKLRHLELDDIFWYKLSKFPARAGKLIYLHNLNKFEVFKEEGYGIEELGSLESLTGTLHLLGLDNVVDAKDANLIEKENLNEVVFEWNTLKDDDHDVPIDVALARQESVLDNLHPHSNVKKLQIINYRGSKFPEWVTGNSLQKLTRVSLNHCTNCKTLQLGELPELKELNLKEMHELTEWTGGETDYWPNLRKLKIIGCRKLQNLPTRLQNLLALQIKNCDSLKDLPATPSLKYLTVTDNANLVNWNGKVSSPTEPLDLKIKNCPNLRKLPEVHLSKLDISDCEQLRNLPPLTYRESIKHLALDTSDDGSLLSVIPHSDSLESLVLSNISRLFSLNHLPHLKGLTVLYIQGCNDLQHLWAGNGNLHSLTPVLEFLSIKNCRNLKEPPESGFPKKLKCLIIESCPDLKNLGTDAMFKDLISLKDLYIENCHSLESFPVTGLPSKLEHLKIVDCTLIAEKYKEETNHDPNWPKIDGKVIPDREIDFAEESSTNESTQEEASMSTSRFKYFRSYCCCK